MIRIILKISTYIFAFLYLSACSHTFIGDEGKESPDLKYKLFVEAHGRSAHAYSESTVKKVYIGIYHRERSDKSMLFSRWAILKAGDLAWKYTWKEDDMIVIDFYEKDNDSKSESCGFISIRKNRDEFRVIDHSSNISFKENIYFF